jgi:hypothetical protein
MNKQAKKILNLINKDEKSRKAYQKDPGKFLKSHGVDIDNLDPGFLKTMSAAGWAVDVNLDTTVNTNNLANKGDNNTLVSHSPIHN